MKKGRYIFSFIVCIIISLSIVSATPNPGHVADQISAGTFSSVDGDAWTMPGHMTLLYNGPALRLSSSIPSGHTFVEFYNDGLAGSRYGWMGYGSSGNTDFTVNNEMGANIILDNNVNINGDSSITGNSNINGNINVVGNSN